MKKKILHIESYRELEEKGKRLEALINLSKDMREKEQRLPIPFNEFLFMISQDPKFVLRDIFQLFYDMMHHYVPKGIEEYPESGESIGYLGYDMSQLFVENSDTPFFADRLFANRIMNLTDSFKSGSVWNHIFLFEGPPGSGKSTFLNNLLNKLEEYTHTDQGTIFKTYWRLDIERLGGFSKFQKQMQKVGDSVESSAFQQQLKSFSNRYYKYPEKYLQFSCPRHDHPILQIPKEYRENFLNELIPDKDFKEKLFTRKEYEWVLKEIPCNICKSLFSSLLDVLGDPLEVFSMITARKAAFNRQFGEGISVFNPGDPLTNRPLNNPGLQEMINNLLRTDNVDFIYSPLAKTNNGVLALMDIKEHNIERLKSLHGIISDGVHKVDLIEEHIKSVFVGLVNPEDKHHFENVKSFQDRIITTCIPYILDYNTEVSIYKNKFGRSIEKHFLPRVLENFAKIIISSRMDIVSPALQKWLGKAEKYDKYLDRNKLLLKMDIYTGVIPDWLSDEDIKNFDKKIRKAIIKASENEGKKGISGRMSLNVFNTFFSKLQKGEKLVTMEMVSKFFSEKKEPPYNEIPDGFVDSLVDLYNYNVLQEVKEAIYYYNEEQIFTDIKNYLFAINYDIGETVKSDFTGDTLDITEDYFKNFEAMLLGTTSNETQRHSFRRETQTEYIKYTLAREMRVEGKSIEETKLFDNLFEKYQKNLKQNALAPYVENDNFRRAIVAFGSPSFENYDSRIKRDVNLLIKNLQSKFKYTAEGARQVSLYVLEKDLHKKY